MNKSVKNDTENLLWMKIWKLTEDLQIGILPPFS